MLCLCYVMSCNTVRKCCQMVLRGLRALPRHLRAHLGLGGRPGLLHAARCARPAFSDRWGTRATRKPDGPSAGPQMGQDSERTMPKGCQLVPRGLRRPPGGLLGPAACSPAARRCLWAAGGTAVSPQSAPLLCKPGRRNTFGRSFSATKRRPKTSRIRAATGLDLLGALWLLSGEQLHESAGCGDRTGL